MKHTLTLEPQESLANWSASWKRYDLWCAIWSTRPRGQGLRFASALLKPLCQSLIIRQLVIRHFKDGGDRHSAFQNCYIEILSVKQLMYVMITYLLHYINCFLKARFLQCGFWPRNSQILIWILVWIFGWIFFLLFFSKEKGQKKIHPKIPRKIHRDIRSENSPRISAEAFSWCFQIRFK